MRNSIYILCLLFISLTTLESRQKYVLPCRKDLLVVSRQVLLEQVGTIESSNRNDGDKIEEYLSSVGLSRGYPYCVAGQFFCFAKAVEILGYERNEIPIPSTGLSVKLFSFARMNGKIKKFSPSMDALVVWQKKKTPFGHTERIVAVGSKFWVETVGFNTKKYDRGRKRFVEGVFRWKRNLLHPLGKLYLLGLIEFEEKQK
ncbi:MAG: hypothetical protein N2517_09015 [Ignavibacteria bacterium]|nr:hypothetical protein [Ignavibacteria bacterium]